jgi:hypothetical protein
MMAPAAGALEAPEQLAGLNMPPQRLDVHLQERSQLGDAECGAAGEGGQDRLGQGGGQGHSRAAPARVMLSR